MKISGFTMVRNATKLYFPIQQSIASILPIVDEFIVALGEGDEDDKTEQEILALNDPKIKIIHTKWDLNTFQRGTENAHQTDIAKEACSGDWLFYLQADEVVHEKDFAGILQHCEQYLGDAEVEGFLFDYYHFWGDYKHFHRSHAWYPHEIRIIRNLPDIHSWQTAQSFRKIHNFKPTTEDYLRKEGTQKLKVVHLGASIYHYGWVRPPKIMQNKRKALDSIHAGKHDLAKKYAHQKAHFDYGPMKTIATFKGTHPKVMTGWMAKLDWQDQLRNSGKARRTGDKPFKHERLKYRILSTFENLVLKGKRIGTFKNYKRLSK